MGQANRNIPHYTIKCHAVRVRKKELVVLTFRYGGHMDIAKTPRRFD